MAGFTKHISENYKRDTANQMTKILRSIQEVLPQYYTEDDIVSLIIRFYPHEWQGIKYKKEYYDIKDKCLVRLGKKARHKMLSARQMLSKNKLYVKINSVEYKKQHAINFNVEEYKERLEKLKSKRVPKILRIDSKIAKAKEKTQSVIPSFLDELIGLYIRKNTSQKDKVYILTELMKYYNNEVIRFFFKLNDIELNIQLREMAFKHLQSFNYSPRLRRRKYMRVNTKNKKRKDYLQKVYPFEKYVIPQNPDELEYRINNGKEQKIKTYDFFISHSSSDSNLVQKLITFQNSKGKNIFCDWINDADYLKRNLLCEATLKVIEKRLEQSNALLFVKTSNSLDSVWCKYELNYFYELNKPIYVIDGENIQKGIYNINKYPVSEYLNKEYKNLALLKSLKFE